MGLVAGGLLLGIGLIYYLATYVVPRAMVTMTKAAPATKVSFNNSLVIGKKILARADGKDSCVVNVFVMDDSNKGVAGKMVEMEAVNKVVGGKEAKVSTLEAVTDKDGNMSFEIVSEAEGQYTVTASIEGIPLSRSLVVTFRN